VIVMMRKACSDVPCIYTGHAGFIRKLMCGLGESAQFTSWIATIISFKMIVLGSRLFFTNRGLMIRHNASQSTEQLWVLQ
jgi:hypothetical protein